MFFTFSLRWLGRTVSRLLGRWNNVWINFNQSESVNSFFLLFLQNLMISGKSIIGKERGQGGGKLCKIEQSLDFWPLVTIPTIKEPFYKRVNWESHNGTTFEFLAMFFATSLEKSIIGKQHGQDGGKWWLINLKQQSKKKGKSMKSHDCWRCQMGTKMIMMMVIHIIWYTLCNFLL